MTFAQRKQASDIFEQQLIARLNSTGWHAYPFGQSLLPQDCRDRLKRFEDGYRRPSLIRWMPDVLTWRDMAHGRPFIALLDAKACGDRPNYAIETSAIETAEIYVDHLCTPTFFVFDDWKVITPREARQRGMQGPRPFNGSGTAYVLVAKDYGRPFDEIFPPARAG